MTSGKEDEEFFRQRGFGIKIGFGERPALIVIDMIKGFTDPTCRSAPISTAQIAAQKPLLDVAHERDIPVIFSTVDLRGGATSRTPASGRSSRRARAR